MFYDVFLSLCQEKGIKPSAAAEACGINRSNVSLWKSKGYTPRGDALNSIAEYFGVSADYLLGNKKEPVTDSDGLTEADRRDIAIELEQLMAEIEQSGDLMFDGDPATPEAMESLRNAMEMGLIYAKKINKEKLGK